MTHAPAATGRASGQNPHHHHVIDLSEHDARAAHELAASCARDFKAADDPRFLDTAPVIAHDLPLAVRRHLNAARRDERTHATMIRGNVVDQAGLGATPGHWSAADTEPSQVYGCLLVLYSALLGDVIGWATQQDGRLVTDVLPSRGYEQSLVSASSELELAWHTEDAFSPHRADWVGLFALRNGTEVPTTVSHIDEGRMRTSSPGVSRTWSRSASSAATATARCCASTATSSVPGRTMSRRPPHCSGRSSTWTET
jgi:Fe(II)/alpha-ketoglutarate-dependent arginine beta-hydroxylase